MTRYSHYTIDILVTSILSVSAQAFLLVPREQGMLTHGLSYPLLVLFAFLYLVASYHLASAILLRKTERYYRISQLVSAILLVTLAFFYISAKLYAEALLLILVSLAQVLASKIFGDSSESFYFLAILVNGTIGAALLFFPNIYIPAPIRVPHMRFFLVPGIGFLLSSFAGGYAFLKSTRKWARRIVRFTAVPWFAWAVASILPPLALPVFIPSFLFAATILSSQYIPWERVILPEDEMLGHLVYPRVHELEALALAFLTFLLYVSEHPFGGDTVLARAYFYEGRALSFFISLVLSFFILYGTAIFHIAINMLMEQSPVSDAEEERPDEPKSAEDENDFFRKIARLVEPFLKTHQGLQSKIVWQDRQIRQLTAQLEAKKAYARQSAILRDLHDQLETQLDEPVAAQLVANAMQKAFKAELAAVFMYDAETREVVALAASGEKRHIIPAGYRQSIRKGIIGRAVRTRKTQLVNNTSLDPDYFCLRDKGAQSEVVVPLMYQGKTRGILLIDSDQPHAFTPSDVETIETAAKELIRTWEQASYDQRLTMLIQAGIMLSGILDPEAAIQETATIARKALQARFVFVTLIDQDGNFTRIAHVGYAPRLFKVLKQEVGNNPLLRTAFNASFPFRVRDVHKNKLTSSLALDNSNLRSLLVIPIRLHGMNIGTILAFGKRGGLFFSEKDESLANLLSSQAGAAIESAWLIQELRGTAKSTTLLYQLSFKIIQSNTLEEAARIIIETAHRMANTVTTGIILFTLDKEIETAFEMDENGFRRPGTVPMVFIEETLSTGKTILVSTDPETYRLYVPIQTPLRKYGVLWMSLRETEREISSQSPTLKTLANQAAIALERSILLSDLREQAEQIRNAYQELENTYDQTLAALMSALDARDRETEGHSLRVSRIACALGQELGLSQDELKSLRRGALLHDIGKIGISDTILHKAGPLSPEEWEIMKQHPDIGVKIVENIPFLHDTLLIIRYHQERWDGSGYPVGLKGKDIPLVARIFAVADVFDALTSNRPYREKISLDEALEYIKEQSGTLFDPDLVQLFEKLYRDGKIVI